MRKPKMPTMANAKPSNDRDTAITTALKKARTLRKMLGRHKGRVA